MRCEPPTGYRRRARPMLGTLVEVGVPRSIGLGAVEAAFTAVAQVQQALSRFDPQSDLGRWEGLATGAGLKVRPATQRVLAAARALQRASAGVFDISLGSGPRGWRCESGVLHRHAAGVVLDAGGIAKGLAVDCAVRALRAAGCVAGWVNAGGDLRAFGSMDLPVWLRDDAGGGTRRWATLGDAALASSYFGPGSRSRLAGAESDRVGVLADVRVSVLAPRCLWADALTKVVAATGDTNHPVLARLGARAFLH